MPRKYPVRPSVIQVIRRNARPILAVILTVALLECPMMFVVMCGGLIVWKVATTRVPDEFKNWR